MVIQTAKEHQSKLNRVETLMDKHSLTHDEEKELDQLVDAIQTYEAVHYPIPNFRIQS